MSLPTFRNFPADRVDACIRALNTPVSTDDPFADLPPALAPSLNELGLTVSQARAGIECTTDAEYVTAAEAALTAAWGVGNATTDAIRTVANVRHLAKRATTVLEPGTIHCACCDHDSREPITRFAVALLGNVGWKTIAASGMWCPDCVASAKTFVLVSSKSEPTKPRRVEIKDGKPASCKCDGFKYRKNCDHMKQAAKMVGGGK